MYGTSRHVGVLPGHSCESVALELPVWVHESGTGVSAERVSYTYLRDDLKGCGESAYKRWLETWLKNAREAPPSPPDDAEAADDEGATAAPAKKAPAKKKGKAAAAAAGAGPGGSDSDPDGAPPGCKPAPSSVHSPPPAVMPWATHSLGVLKRKIREVAEVGELLDSLEAAAKSDMANEHAAEVAETCSYAIERLSFDCLVSTCWTRRVVHPPLYSRLFPARRRIERSFFDDTEAAAYDQGLIADDCEHDFIIAMQKIRVFGLQYQDAAKVRPCTSARSLRDTSRHFFSGSLRRTVAAVYVQMRTDGFRFFKVFEHAAKELEEDDLEMLGRYGCSSIVSLHFRPLNTFAARTRRCRRNAWFASSSTSWLPG